MLQNLFMKEGGRRGEIKNLLEKKNAFEFLSQ